MHGRAVIALSVSFILYIIASRPAVYRNFSKGGANLGYVQKRGRGGGAYMRCYTLHLLGGGKNDTKGANVPPPPPP